MSARNSEMQAACLSRPGGAESLMGLLSVLLPGFRGVAPASRHPSVHVSRRAGERSPSPGVISEPGTEVWAAAPAELPKQAMVHRRRFQYRLAGGLPRPAQQAPCITRAPAHLAASACRQPGRRPEIRSFTATLQSPACVVSAGHGCGLVVHWPRITCTSSD